jgi:hypothetical protein
MSVIRDKMTYFPEAIGLATPAFNRTGLLVIRVDIPGIPLCLTCHTAGYPGENYCPRCGTGFPVHSTQRCNPPYCRQCRQPVIHPVAFFCTCCGEPLEARDTEETEEKLQP